MPHFRIVSYLHQHVPFSLFITYLFPTLRIQRKDEEQRYLIYSKYKKMEIITNFLVTTATEGTLKCMR